MEGDGRLNQTILADLGLNFLPSDQVTDILRKYHSDHIANERYTLRASDVTGDDKGLTQLLDAECYRAAIQLCYTYFEKTKIEKTTADSNDTNGVEIASSNISDNNQPPEVLISTTPPKSSSHHGLTNITEGDSLLTHLTLEATHFYIGLVFSLCKLGLFPQAIQAINMLGPLPPLEEKSPIPFGIYLLSSLLQFQIGEQDLCINNLYMLLSDCAKQMKKNTGNVQIWRNRVSNTTLALCWCLFRMNEFALCLALLDKDLALLKTEDNSESYYLELLAMKGKVNLLLGDCSSAEVIFKELKEIVENNSQATPKMKSLVAVNNGLLSISTNDFEKAKEFFRQAIEILGSGNPGEDPPSLSASARANLIVCSLYTAQLDQGILDSHVVLQQESSQGRSISPNLILNTSFMYELQSSRAAVKKQELLNYIRDIKTDSFPADYLKLG